MTLEAPPALHATSLFILLVDNDEPAAYEAIKIFLSDGSCFSPVQILMAFFPIGAFPILRLLTHQLWLAGSAHYRWQESPFGVSSEGMLL